MDKEQFNRSIGNQIMKIRMQKHLTREHLAEAAGISSKYMYEVEKGNKGCTGYVLYSIAHALSVSVGDLFPKDMEFIDGEFQNEYIQIENIQKKVDYIIRILDKQ